MALPLSHGNVSFRLLLLPYSLINFSINEKNRFTKPKGELPRVPIDQIWAQYNESGHLRTGGYDALPEEEALYDWAKYDNDLFQTARLINCSLYANIILKDYVRTVLNLNRTASTWDLDPRTLGTSNNPTNEGFVHMFCF